MTSIRYPLFVCLALSGAVEFSRADDPADKRPASTKPAEKTPAEKKPAETVVAEKPATAKKRRSRVTLSSQVPAPPP